MPRHSRFLLPATLAVGTAVFGGTLAALSLSGPLDPRAALSGILAAAALTVALAGLLWARHRTGSRPDGDRRAAARAGAQPAADGMMPITIIPLDTSQAVVIFDQSDAGLRLRNDTPAGADGEAARAVDAIWDAVSDAVSNDGNGADRKAAQPGPSPARSAAGPSLPPAVETGNRLRRLARRWPPRRSSGDSR